MARKGGAGVAECAATRILALASLNGVSWFGMDERRTLIVGGLTVTLYTDNYCSFNVTATSLGGCVSATASDVPFRSFSTDGCF